MFSSFDDLECVDNLYISGSYFFERSYTAIDIHPTDKNINRHAVHILFCCIIAPNASTPTSIGNI